MQLLLDESYQQTQSKSSPVRVHAGGSTLEQTILDGIRRLQGDGQPPILDKVIAIYLQNSSQLLDLLRSAVEHDDALRIREVAHRLKSSSASLGALALASLCKELEVMGGGGNTAAAPNTLYRLEREYQAVCQALAEQCRGSRG